MLFKNVRNAWAFTAVAHAKMEQSTGYTWLAMPKMLLSSQDIDGEWAKRD